MHTATVSLVTIVAESVLLDHLVDLLREHGASGYTVHDARGQGSRGRRVGEIPGDNVRIESLVAADVAQHVLEALSVRYFANYAVVAWVTDVRVARGEKYV